MTRALALLVVVVVGLAACGPEVPAHQEEPEVPTVYRVNPTRMSPYKGKKMPGLRVWQGPLAPLQWGQQRNYASPWSENEERPLVTLDPEPRTPVVKTVILSLTRNYNLTGQFAFRWKLLVGAGGASAFYLFDAARLQQVSLPANTVGISLVCTATGPGNPFASPIAGSTGTVTGVAFLADGTTSTDSAVYTETFSAAAGGSATLLPPVGATKYRILGDSTLATTPFSALTNYVLNAVFGATDVYQGNQILALRPQWIPASGQARNLVVANTANPNAATGVVQWGIDL